MPKPLNWKLILILSLVGPAMGLLAVRGLTGFAEPALWIGAGVVSAIIIGRSVPHRHYVHGFIVGLLWGILALAVETLMFDRYLANNPQYAAEIRAIRDIDPRIYMMLYGVIIGIVTGLVLGAMSWLFRRRMAKPATGA